MTRKFGVRFLGVKFWSRDFGWLCFKQYARIRSSLLFEIRSTLRAIRMEYLRSFHRRHFAGKQGVARGGVDSETQNSLNKLLSFTNILQTTIIRGTLGNLLQAKKIQAAFIVLGETFSGNLHIFLLS